MCGGLLISTIFDRAARAERAFDAVAYWCGSSLRNTPVRDFCRRVCDEVRKVVQHLGLDLDDHTLSSISSSSRYEFTLEKKFSLSFKDFAWKEIGNVSYILSLEVYMYNLLI